MTKDIDINEFVATMGTLISGGSTSDHIEFCFHLFDDDRDGFLSELEFENLLRLTLLARLPSLLTHPLGIAAFKNHLKQERSSENLEFWTSVKNLEMMRARPAFDDCAYAIYAAHIAVDGPAAINISARARASVERHFKKAAEQKAYSVPRGVFESAAKQVLLMMEADSFPRFLCAPGRVEKLTSRFFKSIDRDGDCRLSLEEFKVFAFEAPELLNFIGNLREETRDGLSQTKLSSCLVGDATTAPLTPSLAHSSSSSLLHVAGSNPGLDRRRRIWQRKRLVEVCSPDLLISDRLYLYDYV